MAGVPPPPPGFTLDDDKKGAAIPPPPHGFTLDSAPSQVEDVLKNIPSAAIRGVVGRAADIAKGEQLESEQRAMAFPPGPQAMPTMPTGSEAQASVTQALGLHTPETAAGRFSERPTQFATDPVSYLGGGGLMAKFIGALTSGAGSQFAENLTKDSNLPDWVKTIAPTAGAIAGGSVVTPMPSASRQRVEDNATLNAAGVPTDMGQKTGSRMARAVVSQLGSEAFPEQQRHAYVESQFKEVGQPISEHLSESDVNRMMKRVGGQFDAVGGRNLMYADAQYHPDLFAALNQYNAHVPEAQRAPIVSKLVKNLSSLQPGDFLPGDVYQTYRSGIRRQARNSSSPEARAALNGIADTLDNAMERSIALHNPADAGAWKAAREDYKKALTLRDWASTIGGEEKMTPYKLGAASKDYYGGDEGYARGRNPFRPMVDAGVRVLNRDPDTWTATRGNVEGGLKGVGAALGTVLGAGGAYAANRYGGGTEHEELMRLLYAEPLGAAAGAFALRPAARALLTNPATQAYLGNQAIPKYDFPARIARAIAQTQGQ